MSEPFTEVVALFNLDQRDVGSLGESLEKMQRSAMERLVLTSTSFLYLGSLQSSARMQRIACLRSRHLQTSLRPFTRPIQKKGVFSINDAINPRVDWVHLLTGTCTGAYRRLLEIF